MPARTAGTMKKEEPSRLNGNDFFRSLFYFATPLDVALTTFGCVCKAVFGVLQVMILIVFSDFFDFSSSGSFYDKGVYILINMCYFGAGTAVAEGLGSMALEFAKHRQITKWKKEFVKSVLRQDVGWYDVNRPQELSTRMGEALVHIEKGLHSSSGNIFANLGQLIGALCIAFYYSADLAAVTLAVAVLTYVPAVTILLRYLDKRTRLLADAYAGAGGVASEVLSSFRTVASLGLEQRSLDRYDAHLITAERASLVLGRKIFLALSTMNSSMFYVMASGTLYAIHRLVNDFSQTAFDYVYSYTNTTYCANVCDPYNPAQLDMNFSAPQSNCADRPNGEYLVPFRMTCATGTLLQGNEAYVKTFSFGSALNGAALIDAFLAQFSMSGSSAKCGMTLAIVYVATQAVFQGVMGASQIASPITGLSKAVTACRQVLLIIARVPPIDSFGDSGLKPETIRGDIEVRDVWFSYPSAPDHNICQGYSLTIKAGTSAALVGPSGSGKSTIIQLLERYYDPLSGAVLVDGIDLRQMNVQALRRNIGLVGQEPVLFLGTVAENIALGKEGATREEIEAAAELANAHGFITSSLSDGYKTQVGLGGGKLSGGQKQRIAIARAIIKNPAILLLDEATSALDNSSEKVVQASLDRVMRMQRFTSVTIAHRLTTIKNCNLIAVVKKGVIVEQGTWDELMTIGEGGVFYKLAAKQSENAAKDGEVMRATIGEADEYGPASPGSPKSEADSPFGSGAVDTALNAGEAKVDGKKEKKKKEPSPVMRLLTMAPKGDTPFYVIGIVCAAATGVGKGFFGLLFIRSLTALGRYNPDLVDSQGLFWALVFLGVGVGMHACELAFTLALNVTGEHLTKALRHNLMAKLLRQEAGFFDYERNSTGALTEFLGQKVVLINGLVGEKLGTIAQSCTMLVTVIFTMFFWGDWRVTLLVLGMFPIMGASMAVAMAIMMPMDQGKQGKQDKDADAKKSAGSLIGEVVLGIRTVASFNAEVRFFHDYEKSMDAMLAKGKRRAVSGGIIGGLAFGSIFIIFGVEIFYGLYLADVGALVSFVQTVDSTGCVDNNTGEYMDKIMVPIMALMMVMMMMSAMAMMATDAKSASLAARELFERIDRESLIDPTSEAGATLPAVRGDIEVRDVHFTYPTSLERKVMHGYTLSIKAGEVVALCGPSGSGKSTLVSLLQRFYDPQGGALLLDGHDIRNLNLRWLRQQLGMVGQEPVLFEGSVAANIAYGKEGARREEVEEAARLANAHGFITQDLGDGYETEVGLRGGKLSGGQKQRVAIARALVRKPAIMLLDEATSALDNESEKVVQAALDELMSKNKRTTITIAHRLSTIRNADKIAVVSKGRVVEQGTHDELLQVGPRGLYFQLVAAQ